VQVLYAAGQLTLAGSTEPLPPQELFYARPSASIPRLLQALGAAGAQIAEQASSGLARPGDEGGRVCLRVCACTFVKSVEQASSGLAIPGIEGVYLRTCVKIAEQACSGLAGPGIEGVYLRICVKSVEQACSGLARPEAEGVCVWVGGCVLSKQKSAANLTCVLSWSFDICSLLISGDTDHHLCTTWMSHSAGCV